MRRELVGVTARLEQQLAEHSLLEARLRQKQRLETVGTLAGGVAHEFNNVLVPITLYAELALDSLTPDQTAHQDLKRVIAAVRRATSIVSKILTFSRHLEVGSLKPIDIAAAVDEGLRLFTALRPTDIEITTDIAADCRAALADTTLVVQIVMNLCTNAYHAMRPLGGKLHIGLHNVDVPAGSPAELAPGPYVCLSVVDTGHGMDQATRDRIFEPYFTTREVGKGTGLGLSVVHGIVASMGGSIHADSAPQRGTTMQVLIPAVAAATVDNKENA
jgi:signal transduction histidine kinase